MIDSTLTCRQGGRGKKIQIHKPQKMIDVDEVLLQSRLDMIRRWVAKPIPSPIQTFKDPEPAVVQGSCVLIGNKYHAANVDHLVNLGVTAVLNCASGGISRLPVDKLRESGIRYCFTNVRQDVGAGSRRCRNDGELCLQQ